MKTRQPQERDSSPPQAAVTNDVNLLVVTLNVVKCLLIQRSFILPEKTGQAVPRIQDDATTVIPYLNIYKMFETQNDGFRQPDNLTT